MQNIMTENLCKKLDIIIIGYIIKTVWYQFAQSCFTQSRFTQNVSPNNVSPNITLHPIHVSPKLHFTQLVFRTKKNKKNFLPILF